MSKYIIEGGKKLNGRIKISGNKNSILPCMAASLLTEEEVTLRNVPKISDVCVFSEILQSLGAEVSRDEDKIRLRCSQIQKTSLPQELVNKLRASVLLVGPLLSKMGKVEFSHPGGDVIGRRNIDTHLDGFKRLGFSFKVNDQKYTGFEKDRKSGDQKVFLEEPSVTATENLILGAVLGKHHITLKNCATEPHIVDLCNLLNQMGAEIKGVGNNTLEIQGVTKLHGADFCIGSDYIEMGTYAVAAAITGGKITIENCSTDNMEPIIYPLEKMGLVFKCQNKVTDMHSNSLKALPKLKTNIWPGFPTDMMSAVIVLATQSQGVSLLHDWMYESRMFFTDKLISMGANITIADPHRVLVYGPTKLYGRNLETPDIRAGMAMVLAALIAQGTSVINRAELIERGYEDVVEKLSSLGANITKTE